MAKHGGRLSNSGLSYQAAGPQGLYLSIDYESAPVPEYNYVADFVQVMSLDVQALIILGKMDFPENRLRNKLEIYFPAYTFVNQLWHSSRLMHKALREFADETKCSLDLPKPQTLHCDKVQTLLANNVVMVRSGADCLMDFFYLSPKELATKPPRRAPLEMEALVRVTCSFTFLLAFLDRCEPVQEELRHKFGSDFYGDQSAIPETLESR
jgi:hypothetical protein